MSISPPDINVSSPVRYAVIYLRVSTARQASGGGNDEGFSLPAQRDVTTCTAHGLGAYVVKEFIDAGVSGTSIERPALLRMLSFVAENPVDYVVVHKVDRLARNRADDNTITAAIAKAGAVLVSASESIDGSPGGELVHGIMASIAEFYSRNLANEVLKGMNKKHLEGGTPGRAPIGYLNATRIDGSGREYRTIALDESKTSMIRWAFHAYAAGDTSLRQITDSLNLLGLRTSRIASGSGGLISISMLHRILRNPYYRGVVTWRGVEVPGAHEPIVNDAVWWRVQDRLTENRNDRGTRQKHPHHLAGILKCGQCGWRMYITHSRSRSGKIYSYFFCGGRSRRRTDCTMTATSIASVETALEALYQRITITPEQSQRMQQQLQRQHTETMSIREPEATSSFGADELTQKREKILDAYYRDAITLQTLQSKLERLSGFYRAQQAMVSSTVSSAEYCLEMDHIRLRKDACDRFLSATLEQRYSLNRALFDSILLTRGEGEIIELKPSRLSPMSNKVQAFVPLQHRDNFSSSYARRE